MGESLNTLVKNTLKGHKGSSHAAPAEDVIHGEGQRGRETDKGRRGEARAGLGSARGRAKGP